MAVVDTNLLGTRGCLHLCESFPKKNFLGSELAHSSVLMENNIIGVLVFHTRGNGFDGNVWLCMETVNGIQKRMTFLIRRRETQLFWKFSQFLCAEFLRNRIKRPEIKDQFSRDPPDSGCRRLPNEEMSLCVTVLSKHECKLKPWGFSFFHSRLLLFIFLQLPKNLACQFFCALFVLLHFELPVIQILMRMPRIVWKSLC